MYLGSDGEVNLSLLPELLLQALHSLGSSLRLTGIPPKARKMGPKGKKNQSLFIKKPEWKPAAQE